MMILNAFKSLSNVISFYPYSLIWYLLMNMFYMTYHEFYYKSVLFLVYFIFVLSLSKLRAILKDKQLFLIQESFGLVFNVVLIAALFIDSGFADFKKELLFLLFDVVFGEIVFLQTLKQSYSKAISMVMFTIIITIHIDIKWLEKVFLFISIYSNCLTSSNLPPSKVKKKLSKKEESTLFPDDSDLLFQINNRLEIKALNSIVLSSYLDSTGSKETFFSEFLDTTIRIRKEFDFTPSYDQLKDELTNVYYSYDKEEDLQILLRRLFLEAPKNYFCVAETNKGKSTRETLLIRKRNDKIVIKIKQDYFFKFYIKQKLNNNNQNRKVFFVAHDLRTPLIRIIDSINLLDAEGEMEDCKERIVRPALVSCKMMSNLLNDLVDLESMEACTFKLICQEFNLSEFLKETLQIIEFQAEKKGIKLEIKFFHDICTVINDQERLRQVLINLISTQKTRY